MPVILFYSSACFAVDGGLFYFYVHSLLLEQMRKSVSFLYDMKELYNKSHCGAFAAGISDEMDAPPQKMPKHRPAYLTNCTEGGFFFREDMRM